VSGSMLSKARAVDARADAELSPSSIQNSLFMRGEYYRRRRNFVIRGIDDDRVVRRFIFGNAFQK
jgi:hypothetical protein